MQRAGPILEKGSKNTAEFFLLSAGNGEHRMSTQLNRAGLMPVIVCAVACFGVGAAIAASLEVPSKGIRGISQAMIKAKAGDTIWVKAGSYNEQLNVF